MELTQLTVYITIHNTAAVVTTIDIQNYELIGFSMLQQIPSV